MKKLGLGLMRLPVTDPNDQRTIDQGKVNEMVDFLLEKGFTYFDTAYPYHGGMSEAAAKAALVDRYPRDAFLLADKMPSWLIHGPADYEKYFNRQLARCGVEYFDYYLLHSLGEGYYALTEKHDGFAYMKKLKAEGKARHIGFSFHDKAEVLERILKAHPEMEFVQLQLNYLDWDSAVIEAGKCYEVATRYQKPVVVMEPVKGGVLARVPEAAEKLLREADPAASPASWALRFAASLENVMVVLSGMSTQEQVRENATAMADFRPLTDTQKEVLQQVTQIIRAEIAIPCTACRYCEEGCPKHIPISYDFALYNLQSQFGLIASHLNYYANMALRRGRASECIACGQCQEHCPQHIPIVDWLKEVSNVFESQNK